MKKVNIGCGLCAGPSWTNVDGSWNAWFANHRLLARILTPLIGRGWRAWPRGILRADVRGCLPFEPSSFDAVYTSHFLEHLPREDCVATLKRCYHILKPGGVMRLIVPDLEGSARHYLAKLDGLQRRGSTALCPGDEFFGGLFCHSPRKRRVFHPYDWYQRMFDYHTHFWMYDRQSMSKLLQDVGFIFIEERQLWDSAIPGVQEVEREGAVGPDGAGFIIECRKPS